MAKSRAQRKAEQRRRAEQGTDQSRAQHDTQVPESADVVEAELAEQGADLEQLKGKAPSRADVGRPPTDPAVLAGDAEDGTDVAPADKISRRARRQEERDRKQRAKDSERRRTRKEAPAERQRGGVSGFIASCWAELKRVQWPDRETLIQASAITLVFIAAMAAYLGVLDAIFNFLVQRIL